MRKANLAGIAAFAWAAASGPRDASAGNEDSLPVGNRAAMTGGAVTASVSDGSATYYNPAGLGAVARGSIDLSASAYSLRFHRVPAFLSTESAESEASVNEFVAIPTQVAFVRLLGSGLALGLGYFVPRSTDLVMSEHLDAGALAGRSAWDFSLRQNETTYVLAAALGGRVTQRLRLGAAVSGTYYYLAEAATFGGAVLRGAAWEKSAQLAVLGTERSIGGLLTVGAQLDLSDGVTVAVSLKSPTARLTASADGRANSTFGYFPSDGPALLSVSTEELAVDDDVHFTDLGRYAFGAAIELGAGSLDLEADIQPAWRRPHLGIHRRPTWNARIGYARSLSRGVVLGAGLFSDRANEDLRDGLVTGQADFYGGTLGVELNNLHRLASDEPVDSLVLSSVFALRYAYGYGDLRALRGDPEAPVSSMFSAFGTHWTVHEIGLHVGSAFYF